MAAGARTSKGSRRQLRISYVESGSDELEPKRHSNKDQRASRNSSRRGRVHPDGSRSRPGMVDRSEGEARKGRSKKSGLSVDTGYEDERRQSTPKPSSTRGSPRSSRDLRSPGASKTPMAQIAKVPQGQPLPDFITQTDANGNATTPRSAGAIQGARKSHPSGPRARMHMGKDGKLVEDEDGSQESDFDDNCDNFLDSFRMMCCCFSPDEAKDGREVRSGGTEDTDDNRVRLLGPFHPDDQGKKCLVLDLDETLVHSSFRPVPNADFVIPVPIEDVVHFVYVMKRPGVDEFLLEMAKHYEIVIYTASLNKYADPLLDLLDPHRVIRARLFRESCAYYEGNYVKDLSLLDRDLSETIIIDNSPSSYMFHPENAIDCSSFIDDPKDRELDQIGAFLAGIKDVREVRGICHQWRDWPVVDLNGDKQEPR